MWHKRAIFKLKISPVETEGRVSVENSAVAGEIFKPFKIWETKSAKTVALGGHVLWCCAFDKHSWLSVQPESLSSN